MDQILGETWNKAFELLMDREIRNNLDQDVNHLIKNMQTYRDARCWTVKAKKHSCGGFYGSECTQLTASREPRATAAAL